MELNLSCMPWAFHRWKSLKWARYILIFLFGLIYCLLWSWSLGEWVVNAFKGLICLKICLCFCFVGYFLDASSLWTGIVDKCQCWHWGERGKAVTLGKQTSALLWNWTSPFRELFGAEKFYFTRQGWWLRMMYMFYKIFDIKELWGSIFLATLLLSKSIVSFCLLLPASPCSAVSNFKFLAGKILGNNSSMEPSWLVPHRSYLRHTYLFIG